jgi:hypothetical protein
MDGSFACPECGNSLEVKGLAPGRQVRCGFCNRLLEVPFLPRVADAPWRRRRFARPKWFLWVSVALAVVLIAVLSTWAFRFVTRQYVSAQQRPINLLLESSRANEAGGRLDHALLDLDTAIEMARKAGPDHLARLDDWGRKRPGLARREAQNVIDRLCSSRPLSFPLGDWLNLIARADKDRDLSPLSNSINQQFLIALNREIDAELTAARQSFASRQVLASLTYCERIAGWIDHLPPDKSATVRAETENLVVQIVSTHGVIIEPTQVQFVSGSQSYISNMVPVIVKAFEAKGYLPCRQSYHWRKLWKHATYHTNIKVSETLEGNYLSSSNRLTRIEVRLTVTRAGQAKPIFQTTPAASSSVPLPKLPLFLSTRLAMPGERTEEVEKLLRDDARGQIDERLAQSLSNMPECPGSRAMGGQ